MNLPYCLLGACCLDLGKCELLLTTAFFFSGAIGVLYWGQHNNALLCQ